MKVKIGIRREDKNEWERRVPLIPRHVKHLVRGNKIEIVIQPSEIRIFDDNMYWQAGAQLVEDLSECEIILGVKEIPEEFIEPGKTYIFFSHTIKGQEYNMPLLKRMMDLACSLIDYETVVDDEGKRLIFFGRFAGIAGMIDTLWAYGKRFKWEGVNTPFDKIKMANEYDSLEDAKVQIAEIGESIKKEGLPDSKPIVCGITGYGNVSRGAQEIMDLLPYEEISPAELLRKDVSNLPQDRIIKVVFKESDMVELIYPGRGFELQDYYKNPVKYRSRFEQYLPLMDILLNCIYWTPDYPRVVTKDWVQRAWSDNKVPRLKVIGDISIDIGGSIECSVEATHPGDPVYIYDPVKDIAVYGVEGDGPVIMAVDNLPCELSHEASETFSDALVGFIPDLVKVDFDAAFENLTLPDPLKRAMILHKGKLTPDYQYLKDFLNQ